MSNTKKASIEMSKEERKQALEHAKKNYGAPVATFLSNGYNAAIGALRASDVVIDTAKSGESVKSTSRSRTVVNREVSSLCDSGVNLLKSKGLYKSYAGFCACLSQARTVESKTKVFKALMTEHAASNKLRAVS